jgi:putative two-component system response regulator
MSKGIILIVEDNQILQDGLRDILDMEDYTVLTAGDGQEAIKLMEQILPDLILSDIAMPVMDGYVFFDAVRSRTDWVTIPFVFLTARGEREDVLNGKRLGVEDYLVKPLSREELITAVRARLARSQQLQVVQLQQAYEASLTVLANAIDIRDPYTRGHVERVTAYTQELANQLGINGQVLENLRFGAILHDIGKIIVQENSLFKQDPLDEEEWFEIKKHPVTGADMIKDIPFLASAMPVVRYHHERWDGKGYPEHLSGDQIPIGARIVAVADGFDAMTIDRPYRSALSLQQAYDEILRCSGGQFDPEIVRAFQKAWKEGKLHQIWKNWHNNG